MGIVSVRLKRTRQFGLEKDDKGETTRKGQRVFEVVTSDPVDGPDVATSFMSLGGSYNDAYPDVVLTSLDAVETDETGTRYLVTAEYETKPPRDPGEDPEDPDDDTDPPAVSIGFQSFEELAYKAEAVPTGVDADGNVVDLEWHFGKNIRNSAGGKFDPSVEKTYYDLNIKFSRTELGTVFTPATALAYIGRVNSADFTITYPGGTFPVLAKTCKIVDISADLLPSHKWRVSYDLVIRSDEWRRKVLDEGLMELNNGDYPGRPIRDAQGEPVTTPHLLDGTGKALTGSDPTPIFLVFQLDIETAFGALAL